MKLTKELVEAAVWEYLIGKESPAKNGNGIVERSKYQRRRGRPPKVRLTKEQDNNRGWDVKKKRLGRPPKIKVED